MTTWHTDRLPTAADADLHGPVLWNPRLPGLLIPWHEVQPEEASTHSAAWRPPTDPPAESAAA